MIKLTNTVKHLIIINVLFFVATFVFKEQIYELLGMHFPINPSFKSWQIVTHMFMHGDEMHLIFNMLGLWMFGSIVESILERDKFLVLFFLSGLGAVLLHFGIQYIQYTQSLNEFVKLGFSSSEIIEFFNSNASRYEYPTVIGKSKALDFINLRSVYYSSVVGASGALYGIMVAFGVMFPKEKLALIFLPIPIEARIFIPIMLLLDMFFGIFSIKGDNIAHFAHIGGAIVGFLLIWTLKKHQYKRWF